MLYLLVQRVKLRRRYLRHARRLGGNHAFTRCFYLSWRPDIRWALAMIKLCRGAAAH